MHRYIIEPDEVEALRGEDHGVIVDLSQTPQYASAHIPEALHLPYGLIVRTASPVMGLVPSADVFSRLVVNLGIDADSHVIAYDDEGGGCAARQLWTLQVYGHENTSLINGGLFSWANEGHDISALPPLNPTPTSYLLTASDKYSIDTDDLIATLDQPDLALLDARSADEYSGRKRFADRAGHIPGAIHFEWTEAMDRNNNMRLQPDEQLRGRLESIGLTADKDIVCYCQTHHRSAFSWLMLKHLGYDRVRGYAGSWSAWGNRQDTPVETTR